MNATDERAFTIRNAGVHESLLDLFLFTARDFSELLARPQADRRVRRGGAPIDTTLPDYRELDDLMRRE